MRAEININGNVLTWAIARAGHDLHEFVDRFPKVKDWLDQTKKPTIRQLQEFSNRVHVPFGYLLLSEPPKEHLPIPFFRTATIGETSVSLNVYDTISLIQRRQEWLVDYLKDSGFDKLPFVGKFSGTDDFAEVVHDIRFTLNLDYEWARNFKTWEIALDHLTGKIEEIGIILSFNSVVENNTSRPIVVEECRGFVLVSEYAPFMFINSADGKAAQLFTIVHELAHIWVGQSAGFDIGQLQPANNEIELFCDKVAAEFLVPRDSITALWTEKQDVSYLSRYFKVSPIVIARRALDLGLISRPSFFEFYNNYIKAVKDKKERQTGGGDFYATQRKRLSLRFAAFVNNAVKENKLLYRDAYKITGLKGNTYETFITKNL